MGTVHFGTLATWYKMYCSENSKMLDLKSQYTLVLSLHGNKCTVRENSKMLYVTP